MITQNRLFTITKPYPHWIVFYFRNFCSFGEFLKLWCDRRCSVFCIQICCIRSIVITINIDMYLKILFCKFFSIVTDTTYFQIKCIISMTIAAKTAPLTPTVAVNIWIL